MSTESTKKSVIKGLFWKFMEVMSVDGVSFIISIILARILSPKEYGELALVNIFITLANVFVVYGLGTALIQKKNADSKDFSSVFYFNGVLSIVLYFTLFFLAPIIAKFYNVPSLVSIIRVLGLRLPLASVITVQNAYISRNMQFKKTFWASLFGTSASGVIGIVMALTGFGVMALVAQVLSASLVNCVVLFFVIKWRPTLEFSWSRLKGLISYGWKLLVSGFIKVGYAQLSGLIIGKKHSGEDLSYYEKGKKYPALVVDAINTSMGSVLFPAFSKSQDERAHLKHMVRKSIGVTTFIMTPLLLGLAVLAKPVILFLLTEKWIGCVPFLQIACLYFMLEPIQTANLQAIRAVGRSDVILWLDIVKRGSGVIMLLVAMNYGVIYIALAPLGVALLASIVNVIPNKKLIKYSLREQLVDVIPNIFISAIMASGVLVVSNILMNGGMANILVILIGVLLGAISYVGLCFITRNKNFKYVIDSIKEHFPKKTTTCDKSKQFELKGKGE